MDNKLYLNTLPTHSQELLVSLMDMTTFNDFYLVGGTALALQIGHRISVDLDLFTNKEFSSNIIESIKNDVKILSLSDNSIEIVKNDTKLFFFYFNFKKYKELKTIGNIRLADPVDIGLMKLLALQGRTSRKDMIDLYFLDKKIIELEELLKIFETHYPKESFNSYSSLKTLFDMNEFINQPMPKMIEEAEWDEVVDTVTEKVARHIKNLVG